MSNLIYALFFSDEDEISDHTNNLELSLAAGISEIEAKIKNILRFAMFCRLIQSPIGCKPIL